MIDLKQCSLGIELGSTRIKAVLVGDTCKPVAQGDFTWENRLENGIWTYPLEEVWQGVQAVQLVGCGVIGAALAVLLVSVCFWLAVLVGGVICCGGGVLVGSSTGPGRHRSAPIRQAIRYSGQAAGPAAGRWAKEKVQGRRRGVRCCSGLWSALAAMVPAGCVPVPVVGLICWRCRWAWSALAPFPLAAFQRHG